MKTLLTALAFSMAALTGCAVQQAAPAPDIVINAPALKVRDNLAGVLAGRGGKITTMTDNMLIVEKPLEGLQATMAQLALGNAYSTPPKGTVQFVFISPTPDSVRVIGSAQISTQMAFGQVSSTEATGAYLGMQRLLADTKSQMESGQ